MFELKEDQGKRMMGAILPFLIVIIGIVTNIMIIAVLGHSEVIVGKISDGGFNEYIYGTKLTYFSNMRTFIIPTLILIAIGITTAMKSKIKINIPIILCMVYYLWEVAVYGDIKVRVVLLVLIAIGAAFIFGKLDSKIAMIVSTIGGVIGFILIGKWSLTMLFYGFINFTHSIPFYVSIINLLYCILLVVENLASMLLLVPMFYCVYAAEHPKTQHVVSEALTYTNSEENATTNNATVNQNVGAGSRPAISPRSVALWVILDLFTCGIGYIVWTCFLVKDIHTLHDDSNSGVGEILLILFIPFYNIYWVYTRGKQMYADSQRLGLNFPDDSVVFLILNIFGLGIVTYAIMQSRMNSITQ